MKNRLLTIAVILLTEMAMAQASEEQKYHPITGEPIPDSPTLTMEDVPGIILMVLVLLLIPLFVFLWKWRGAGLEPDSEAEARFEQQMMSEMGVATAPLSAASSEGNPDGAVVPHIGGDLDPSPGEVPHAAPPEQVSEDQEIAASPPASGLDHLA